MSQRSYQPLIKHLYKQSRSKLPIDIWVHAVGSKLAVVKADEIYEPIVMRIKTTGKLASPDGTVKHTVNPEEKDWYTELRTDLAKVAFGLPAGDARYLSLRNMENQDIANFTHNQLMTVGEVDVYDTRDSSGRQLLAPTRKQPSAHLHSNKLQKLYEWSEDLNAELATQIARSLAGSANIEELEMRTQPGSALHASLVKVVEKSGQFSNHGATAAARAVPPSQIADRIATAALDQMCAGIDANGKAIVSHFASTVAAKATASGASTRAPLLQQFRATAAVGAPTSFKTDTELYAYIANKALVQGPHVRKTVYMAYKPVGCATEKTYTPGQEDDMRERNRQPKHDPPMTQAEAKARNHVDAIPDPTEAFIGRCHTGGKHGEKKDKKKKPDAVKSEARQFQLFSGRSVYMSPQAPAAAAPKGPQGQQSTYRVQSAMPALGAPIPMGAPSGVAASATGVPDLVHVDSPAGIAAMERRQRLLIEANLDELEPIPSPMRNAKVGSAMPLLVRSDHAPSPASAYADLAAGLDELEPIECDACDDAPEAKPKRKGKTSFAQEPIRASAAGGPPPMRYFSAPQSGRAQPARVGQVMSMADIMKSGDLSF